MVRKSHSLIGLTLKNVPSGIANCRNLPFGGRARWNEKHVRLLGRKRVGVATNIYSRKTSEKPERCGLRTLSVKGSGVVFTHGEGISTPRVRRKGRQPLIKCANMTSIRFIFPFYVLMSFCAFLYFSFFVVDKGVPLCSYVFLNYDEEIRPT